MTEELITLNLSNEEREKKYQDLMREKQPYTYLISLLRRVPTMDQNESDKKGFMSTLREILERRAMSGGAGSEVFTRLGAFDFIDDIPNMSKLSKPSGGYDLNTSLDKYRDWEDTAREKVYRDSSVEVSKEGDTTKVQAEVYFIASVPDDEGRETYYDETNPWLCKTTIDFSFDNTSLQTALGRFTEEDRRLNAEAEKYAP